MNTILAFFKTKVGIAAVFVVALGSGYWFFATGGTPQYETLVVKADEFTQQVSISGKVIAAQEVALGFTSSGRITRVNVRVGDRVGAGATLASIDSADLQANILQREAALEVQKARLAALQQGARPEEVAVAEADVAAREDALTQTRTALADSIRDAYIKTDDAIRNRVYQFVDNPQTNPKITLVSSDTQSVVDANAEIVQVETALDAWQADLATMDSASDLSGHVSRAQQRLASASALLNTVSKVLNSSTLVNVTQATLDGYMTSIATARTNVSTASSAITSAVTSQRSAGTALESSRRALTLKMAGTVQADIDAQVAQVKVAEADLANARSLIGKTVISAPFSGVVTKVDAKVGKIVSPNTPEITLNSSAAFQIESYVPEVNISIVKVGDTAVVTLDAYGTEVPFIAKVVSIDPAETIKDGVPTYRALLQFDANDSRIRSGMSANIVVTTAQKSDVVSIPQGLVIERNGKKYVKVLDGEAVIEREVTTGTISSLGNIEVLTGLGDGDIVIVSAVN